MPDYFVSMEAISFGKVMFDTDDLSAIRGASWAMLKAADCFAEVLEKALKAADPSATVREEFAGASIAEVRAKTSLAREDLENLVREILSGASGDWPDEPPLKEVLPFLRFAVAVTSCAGDDEKDRRANRAARAFAQFRMMDVDLPAPLSKDEAKANVEADATAAGDRGNAEKAVHLIELCQPCVKDRTRPIARLSWRSADPDAGETDGKPRRDVPVSESFLARHDFGRTGRRPLFYNDQANVDLNSESVSIADSFEEIAHEAPPGGLPATVRNKMCVLYMDGNSFGMLQRRWLKAGGDEKGFAEAMKKKRKALLGGLVELFLDEHHSQWLQLANPAKQWLDDPETNGWVSRETPVLRFETLMWGADESMLVFPGWAFLAVMRRLEELLADDAIGKLALPNNGGEIPLTYGFGVAIGHYKTPIRAMKVLAEALADSAKACGKRDAGGDLMKYESFVDYMVLGGIDMPVRSLAAERAALFNIPEEAQDEVFPLPLAGFGHFVAQLERVRGESGNKDIGAPRAKLVEILSEAREQGEIHESTPKALEELNGLLEAGKDAAGESLKGALTFNWSKEAPLAPLLHLVQLWNHLGLVRWPENEKKPEGELEDAVPAS